MRITVLLFARLRDIAGTTTLNRNLPDGSTTRFLWKTLVQDFPEFESYSEAISTAVNEEYSRMDSELSDGDEVAFLPPVSGG
ncbi:MAG: molybdopterin converting factor subunit 1 [Acidobacteriota bacterium]|nr:molybdopterin converting factor subunit 1 [Acidobacteriota bacterium]|tara:strand:- start:225 stop:470 length:246 start_codon:yes stop_codon:yes gene_type:complete